jgi:hypothetical protein
MEIHHMTSDWQIIVRINKDGQKMEMENMEFKDLPKALEQVIEGGTVRNTESSVSMDDCVFQRTLRSGEITMSERM